MINNNIENIDYSNPILWGKLSKEDKDKQKTIRPSLSYWQDVKRRFYSNKISVASALFIVLLLITVIILPYAWPYTFESQDFDLSNALPSWSHPFGCDNLGRDLFIRCVYGTRISLIIGIFASIVNLIVGVTYGGISGYSGGKLDNILMRIADIISTIPLVLYVILLMVFIDDRLPDLPKVLIAIGTTYWIGMARIVRGQVFSLKEQEYILAAEVLGASKKRILFMHLIPNAMGPIIINLTMSIPSAIFTEAFLAFIGLGVTAPMASLGSLANDALQSYTRFPHLLFFPAIVLFFMILAFNFIGDGLRDALDPKMRK